MNLRLSLFFVASVMFSVCPQRMAFAAITLGGPTSSVGSAAQANGIQPGDFATPSSLPFTQTIGATLDSGGSTRYSTASSFFDLTSERLAMSASHDRGNGGYTLSQMVLSFTSTGDTPYTINGTSTAEAGSTFHSLRVRLRVGEFGSTLFESYRTYGSGSPAAELITPQTFTVGQGGMVTGLQTGTLMNGVTYQLLAEISGRSGDAAASSGAGNVTVSVPEPTSLATVIAASGVLLLRRRP